MAPVSYKQDMPPAGGYAKIYYDRIPARKLVGPFSLITGFFVISLGALAIFQKTRKRLRFQRMEMRDCKIALEPFLIAERDREYLKQLARNREEEIKLMKDVPGWECGTLYGERIYKTVPEDRWFDPLVYEYYAHTSTWDANKRIRFADWH